MPGTKDHVDTTYKGLPTDVAPGDLGVHRVGVDNDRVVPAYEGRHIR